ncbi:MAG: hypothetical protein LBS86_04690 [Treponema sp.]|jgi:uncharacterized protein YaiI (UPF0178 family)|nr:hypothetical protein [Treponema sp.]
MAHYEMIREIFNSCERNQMRDVFISELETDDPDSIISQFLSGKDASDASIVEKSVKNGVIVYELDIDGLQERVSFSPLF